MQVITINGFNVQSGAGKPLKRLHIRSSDYVCSVQDANDTDRYSDIVKLVIRKSLLHKSPRT